MREASRYKGLVLKIVIVWSGILLLVGFLIASMSSANHIFVSINRSSVSTVLSLLKSATLPTVDKDMLACGVPPKAPIFMRFPCGHNSAVQSELGSPASIQGLVTSS